MPRRHPQASSVTPVHDYGVPRGSGFFDTQPALVGMTLSVMSEHGMATSKVGQHSLTRDVRLLGLLRRDGEYCKGALGLRSSTWPCELSLTSSFSPPRVETFASDVEAYLHWLTLERTLRREGWWSADDPDL